MIRSLPLVRRTLLLSVCGLFLFSGRLFAGNPLLMPSEAPYGAPRFDRIHAADIMPAIEEGIRAYKAGIAKIRALDPAEATFENVVVPLDCADSLLDVPRAVLGYLKSNFGGDSVIRISLESAQLTGEAYDAVTLDTAIFRLVKAVYDRRDAAGLDSLQLRTLGKVYRSYIRGGALCTPGQKVRLKELNREISLKRIRHGQNITQATQEFVLYVQDSSLLDGLAGTTRQRFARNAARQGHQGVWAVGFTNGDYASVMASATNRDLRRRLYEAYTSRCMDGKYDNRQLSVDIVNLRLERARMLGYENYAAYTLETNMAGTPEKVRELLLPLKDAAAGKGRAERAELEAFAVKYERDSAFRLEPWDVAFYSGKLRKAKFGSELGRMRNYLLFDNVLNDGVFYVANRLFGITLTQRTDIPVFHPDVLTFEAKDAEGRPLGLLYLDCFVRKGKRGGAWCSRLRGYSCAGEREVLPLVTISCNFSRAAEGRPKLLSTSEVKTLFHEFGHALAGPLARAVSTGDGQLPARHGRTALAVERALGLGAGGDETLRPRLQDGASDSRCADREVQGVGELPEGALPDRFLCHRAARPRMAHRAAAGRRVRRGGFRTGVPETLRLPGAYRFTLPDDLLQPHLRQQLPRAVLLLHVVGGAGHRCLRGIHRHGRYFRFRNRAPLPPPYPDRSGL